MAKKDVEIYYQKLLSQYLAAQADLAEFEAGVANGYVTEDKLDEVRDEFNNIATNKFRAEYILYLLNMPQKQRKKAKYNSMYKDKLKSFAANKATLDDVLAEDADAADTMRAKLSALVEPEK